jgi:hydrogenase nickel incorporation protein HypB
MRKEELEKNANFDSKMVEVATKILSKNDKEANALREVWKEHNGLYVINLMSSPGSGKTTLLENLAGTKSFSFGVIEGDLETNRDAERLEAKGVRAHQITTGNACHLEAKMVSNALSSFKLDGLDLLFIENVGNLVCPASYDLGAHLNVALLSVPEGDDKVLKYPTMFRTVDALIITKWDLKPHFDFDESRVRDDLKQLNPNAKVFTLSSKDESIKDIVSYFSECKSSGFISESVFV